MPEPIIRAEGLVKKFGQFTAVAGISFRVEPAECFGFLGPNGAGKTTTVRMIHCVSPKSGGTLTVDGMEANVDNRQIKKLIGVVPQEINLDGDLTVYENLLLFSEFYDIKKKVAEPRIAELLDFIELRGKADSKIDELSTGMKRRLQIARALLNQPKIIIADEPTTGLDPQARHLIWQRLRELKKKGATMILTTQYMEEAEQLCDRVVIMRKGKIIELGAPEELKQKHQGKDLEEVYLKLTGHALQEEGAE